MTGDLLRHVETDLLGPDFIGIQEIKELLEKKLFDEARRKFSSPKEQSSALGLHTTNYYRKLREFRSVHAAPEIPLSREANANLI